MIKYELGICNHMNTLADLELAQDVNTPKETLELLAKTSTTIVRSWVANNLSTPVSTLIKLAEDANPAIQQEAVNNPNTPEAVKLWFKSGGFADMTLLEFLKGVEHYEASMHTISD
jgi:hypothetical protein